MAAPSRVAAVAHWWLVWFADARLPQKRTRLDQGFGFAGQGAVLCCFGQHALARGYDQVTLWQMRAKRAFADQKGAEIWAFGKVLRLKAAAPGPDHRLKAAITREDAHTGAQRLDGMFVGEGGDCCARDEAGNRLNLVFGSTRIGHG